MFRQVEESRILISSLGGGGSLSIPLARAESSCGRESSGKEQQQVDRPSQVPVARNLNPATLPQWRSQAEAEADKRQAAADLNLSTS